MLRTIRLAVLCSALLTAHGSARAGTPVPAGGHRASARAVREYLRARLAEAAGDHGTAIEALRLALVSDPDSPQLRIAYADALARGGRITAAESEARRAVELAEDPAAAADAHRVLGKILLARGRLPEAEKILVRASELEADRVRTERARTPPGDDADVVDPEAWRLLAEARRSRGDHAGAIAAGEDLAKLDPVFGAGILRELAAKLLEGRDAGRAEAVARRSTEIATRDGAGWRLLSRAQEEQGRFDDARRSLERALEADPSDPEALLSAGQLSLRSGDLPGARGWFQQLLRVAPEERTAQIQVATSWLEAKRPAEALDVVAAGEDPELLYVRGLALVRLRRWPDAISTLERIGSTGGEVDAHASALLAHALSRSGRTADAIGAARRGLERAPREPGLLFALGEVYDRAGDRDAALAQMRAVLQVRPDYPEAMNYLGYAYAEKDERLDEAEGLLTRALRAEPDNAYYLDSLGWILLKRHDLGRAVETLERATALAPELTILDHLGDAYRASQRPGDAAGAYRRALQAGDPDDDEPGVTAAERRAQLQKKLDDLGVHEGRAANLRR